MEIVKGKIIKPVKVCIYGPAGIGKSTFASQFPNALFIDTEDSTIAMDVDRLPRPTSWMMLMAQVDHIKKNPDLCKTLVVDTADWAERLCIDHICAKAQVDGLEGFGYGKGYVYLEEEFGRFLNKLQDLIEIGKNIVMAAHAEIKKIEQPEEIGGYDHWQLKLAKKTMPLVKEWADVLLFANYKTYVINVDNQGAQKGKNKAKAGKRVMYTSHTPWWDAKNRHGLPEELLFNYKEIAHIIPITENKPEAVKEKTKPAEQVKPEPEQAVKKKEPEVKAFGSPPQNLDSLPKALVDLMVPQKVTVSEVQRAVAQRGYYPVDTPIENYDPGFVQGVLVAAWDQVFKIIQLERDEEEELLKAGIKDNPFK